jgi:hypothetical protein
MGWTEKGVRTITWNPFVWNFVAMSDVNQKTTHFLFGKIGNNQEINHLPQKIKLSENNTKQI